MEPVSLVALGLSLVTLLWQVGSYVSKKTKNTVDDAVFQHPEIEAAVKAVVEAILKKRP